MENQPHFYCKFCSFASGFGFASVGKCGRCNAMIGSCSDQYCESCSFKLKACFSCGCKITDGNKTLSYIQKKCESNALLEQFNDEKDELEKELKGKTLDEMLEMSKYPKKE